MVRIQSCLPIPNKFSDQFGSFTDPYADPSADDATPLHFTGKEHDTESDNDYFEARYYANSMGRFMSPDWSAKVEPIPYAKLDNPQSLNLYAYVGNNPLTDVDVDGHMSNANFSALFMEGLEAQSAAWQDEQAAQASAMQSALQATQFAMEMASWSLGLAPQAQQQNSQNQSDQPSFSLRASRGNLELNNANGDTVADYKYTTGMNGDTNPADKGRGPIPPGKYTIDPKEMSKAGFFRKHIDARDWGDYRFPLHPESGTDVHGRSGLFLHGGWLREGSEGCIKVNDLNQSWLFQLLQNSRGPVEVTVE